MFWSGKERGLYRNCAKYPPIALQYTLVNVGRCVDGNCSYIRVEQIQDSQIQEIKAQRINLVLYYIVYRRINKIVKHSAGGLMPQLGSQDITIVSSFKGVVS